MSLPCAVPEKVACIWLSAPVLTVRPLTAPPLLTYSLAPDSTTTSLPTPPLDTCMAPVDSTVALVIMPPS